MKFFAQSAVTLLAVFIIACTPESPQQPPEEPPAEPEMIPEPLPDLEDNSLDLSQISLPDGFEISLFAGKVEGARSMVLSENGTLFVGTRQAGKVYALQDRDNNGKADQMWTIASGLNSPNGVDLKNGDLYVAEINRIIAFNDIENQLENPPEPRTVYDDYPTDTHHGWKYIHFGPDEKLYIPVGAPCNICLEEDPVYASITTLDVKTGDMNIIASGIRNTVGFDWHPDTGELWFTDNGADWLGNDQPDDELNIVRGVNPHFGFPYCHEQGLSDKTYGNLKDCEEIIKPTINLGPHVAALGMEFYRGEMFPDEYKQHIFIAEHGSWNRNPKSGYQLSIVKHDDNEALSYEPFATGWLQGISHWGRPVDVEVMPDGSLLVSDDFADAIYRITYRNPATDR